MNRDNAGNGLRGLRANMSPELLEALRDCYGIDSEEDIIDLGGSSSLNLLVSSGNCQYVLRVYRPYVTETRLRDIQLLKRELTACGVPCSEVVAARDGQTWIIFDDRLIEVEYYIEHDAKMDTWELLEAGLPTLGRLHTILQNIKVSADLERPLFANHIKPHDALNMTLQGTQRIRNWDELLPTELKLADAADELAHLVFAAEKGLVATLPRQLVHGDFWDDNVFFRDGSVVFVADFDFTGERARIDDLALTLYFTCLKYSEDQFSDNHLQRLRRLVDAYDSGLENPLTGAERAALPLAITRQPLWSIGGWVALLDDEESARQHAAGSCWEVEWALRVVYEIDRWREAFV